MILYMPGLRLINAKRVIMISVRMEQQKDRVVARILALTDAQQSALLDKLRNKKNSPFHYHGLSLTGYIAEIEQDIEKLQDDKYQDLHDHLSDLMVKKYQVILLAIGIATQKNYFPKVDKRRLLKVEESKKKQYQYKVKQ